MNIKKLRIVLKKIASNIKTDPKSFYAYVRSKSKTKTSVGLLKNGDGVLISDDLQMNAILNSYFGSVFTKESDKLPKVEQVFIGDLSSNLIDILITPEMIVEKLKKLKSNKAPGTDGLVSDFFLKTCETIYLPLNIIFTKTLNEGVVPEDWKLANVSAIFKNGTKDNVGNYRPVSFTAQACKLLESILRDNIIMHLREFNLINSSQHGFV